MGYPCWLLMPPRAHSISAGRRAAPDTAPFPVLHGLLESATEIAVGCLCLGDFFPHDSGLRSGAGRAAMCVTILALASLSAAQAWEGPIITVSGNTGECGADQN